MGLWMRPRNDIDFTLFGTAGSNAVDSAAILMEFVALHGTSGLDHDRPGPALLVNGHISEVWEKKIKIAPNSATPPSRPAS